MRVRLSLLVLVFACSSYRLLHRRRALRRLRVRHPRRPRRLLLLPYRVFRSVAGRDAWETATTLQLSLRLFNRHPSSPPPPHLRCLVQLRPHGQPARREANFGLLLRRQASGPLRPPSMELRSSCSGPAALVSLRLSSLSWMPRITPCRGATQRVPCEAVSPSKMHARSHAPPRHLVARASTAAARAS